ATTGKLLGPLTPYQNTLDALAFSPDGNWLASGSHDSKVQVWNVAERQQRDTLVVEDMIRALAFGPHDKKLACAGTKQVKIWDLARGKERSTLKGQFGEIWALALSPDSKRLAFLQRQNLDADFEICILDVDTSRERFRHKGKGREFQSVAFTAGGKLFVMGST